MTEWGFNPESVAAAGTVVAALALLAAITGAYFESRRRRRERNLQAFLAISVDIRNRWETKWATLLREEIPRLGPAERLTGPVGREIEFMLNWLDWLGLALKMRLVDRELVLGSVGPTIIAVLRETAIRIQSDSEDPEKGPRWWANVLYIAALPEIDVDVEREAAAIRARWSRTQQEAERPMEPAT